MSTREINSEHVIMNKIPIFFTNVDVSCFTLYYTELLKNREHNGYFKIIIVKVILYQALRHLKIFEKTLNISNHNVLLVILGMCRDSLVFYLRLRRLPMAWF